MADYKFGYTGAKMNELFGKIEPLETTVNNLNTSTKFFTNVSVPVNAWASNNTYSQYPYRATVSANGITSTYYCEIIFNLSDAISGYFAPICESTTNGIYIYASAIPLTAITIPTIKCTKTT